MEEEEGPPGSPNRLYKIVFVGDSGVGKSSLIHRFCFNQFKTNFSATIGKFTFVSTGYRIACNLLSGHLNMCTGWVFLM